MATIGIAGRSIPATTYLAGIRRAKAQPDVTFSSSLRGPGCATGAEVMAQYRADLHTRINRRAGRGAPESRVHPATWAQAATPRVILEPSQIRTMPRRARARLQHRMRDFD